MGAGVRRLFTGLINVPIQRHCKELTIICAVELTQLYQIAKANDFRQHPNGQSTLMIFTEQAFVRLSTT